MKAIILREIGGPENLILADVPLPAIADDEVLVQVKGHNLFKASTIVTGLRKSNGYKRFLLIYGKKPVKIMVVFYRHDF